MVQYNTFNHKNSKLNELYSTVQKQKAKVPELVKPEPVEYSVTYLKKNNKIELDTTPIYYDLYNWLGTTYASGDRPEPAEAYVEGYRGWYWRYPVFNFRVPKDSTPMTEVPGTLEEQWEYASSVAGIRSSIFIKNLNDQLLNYAKVKAFLYNENNEPASSEGFGDIFRWHKEHNGYTLHYNAFYPVEEDDSQLFVKVEIILMNPSDYDALYQTKLI